MVKYYYENGLGNQNQTAKPDIAWVAVIAAILDLPRIKKIIRFNYYLHFIYS
jgi:hypothetical protein